MITGKGEPKLSNNKRCRGATLSDINPTRVLSEPRSNNFRDNCDGSHMEVSN
jgi:hypothetical protein